MLSGLLDRLARLCALAAGLLLTAIMLLTCASVLGRNSVGWTLVGDFELVGFACGAAVALFMPWCQLQRGHIRVDFFTAHAPQGIRRALDRLGALWMAAVFGLLAWRGAVGGVDAYTSQSSSMILAVPQWWVYAAMVPPLALAALIALAQVRLGLLPMADGAAPQDVP